VSTVPAPPPASQPLIGVTPGKTWLGHPRGLSTLFFTEMWERFSYYGMRAILLLFMTAPVAGGGLGWDAAKAGPIYGLYTALVYFTALPGGWIADQFIGPRRAVLFGGIIIALGHVCLAFHGMQSFFFGLFLIIMGTGLLKPNISAMVGQLYAQDDKRRDAGFSLFYMGINLGAGLSPLVIGFLAQHTWFKNFLQARGLRPEDSWHWGFAAAAVGMTLGIIQYIIGGRHLGKAGLEAGGKEHPEEHRKAKRALKVGSSILAGLVLLVIVLQKSGALTITPDLVTKTLGWVLVALPFPYFAWLIFQRGWTSTEKKRLATIPAFFLFASLFWSVFEQAGSTLTLFADRFTRKRNLRRRVPVELVAVGELGVPHLVGAGLRVAVAASRPARTVEPREVRLRPVLRRPGFFVHGVRVVIVGPQGKLVSPMWLLMVYLAHTIGELCLSPVGLSTMTKLAPARIAGQMLGVWFLASSVGNFIGGSVSGLFEKLPLPQLFGAVVAVTLVFTVIAILLVKPIRRLMGGVH
jgi:POT family proton-dependent oligopeptide transporter